jgi:hypothetical protein
MRINSSQEVLSLITLRIRRRRPKVHPASYKLEIVYTPFSMSGAGTGTIRLNAWSTRSDLSDSWQRVSYRRLMLNIHGHAVTLTAA